MRSALIRSSHQRCSVRKGVLRNFAIVTLKHKCQSLFFSKVAGLRSAISLKKRLRHKCFPVNFVKFLRIPFSTEHLWWLLLYNLWIIYYGIYGLHYKGGYLYFPAPGPLLGPWPWPPICISRPGSEFVFTGPGPQFVFTGPDPQWVLTDPGQK